MSSSPSSTPEAPPRAEGQPASAHEQDLELVRRILGGDAGAWNFFVERYAGLILAMSRRYLRSRDQDDIRTVFVNTLDSLIRTRLRTYEGRASLATWLTLVARSEVMDHLRRRFGRDQKLRVLDRLTPAERQLFRLYYVEGLSYREVVSRLATDARPWSVDEFVSALHEIEAKLGARWLRRIAYDLHAQSIGVASGRLLEYLDHVRHEFSERTGSFCADYHIMEREARRTADHLRAMIAALCPRDRRLLELRFERGWTAGRIASELGMTGQRSVYKSINRIVARLRRLLRTEDGSS